MIVILSWFVQCCGHILFQINLIISTTQLHMYQNLENFSPIFSPSFCTAFCGQPLAFRSFAFFPMITYFSFICIKDKAVFFSLCDSSRQVSSSMFFYTDPIGTHFILIPLQEAIIKYEEIPPKLLRNSLAIFSVQISSLK